MSEILYRYKEYEIEYNRGLGIITINKKIPVKKFMELKRLTEGLKEVKEIRVESDKLARWHY